jgi:hypothetical protein
MLANMKCKKILKSNFVVYKLDGLVIKVHKKISKKIDKFIQMKKYQMLEKFIDIYSDMFITNFKGEPHE